MNENAIRSVVSNGATCFKCEREIQRFDGCVMVEFKIPIPLLGSTTKEEFAHPDCADKVAMELHAGAADARRLKRRP